MQELTPPPLLAYMHAKTTVERDVAYLRLYAEKIRNRSETIWEIPNTRAATVEDIAKRFEAHYRQAEATVTALRETLATHGRHKPGCRSRWRAATGISDLGPCDCGLEAVLQGREQAQVSDDKQRRS